MLKTVEKDAGGTITDETRYVYDGLDLIAELDGSNLVIASYTHGPGIDDPLIMRYGGADYFYHKNHLGSVVVITDINQNIVKKYEYDAFGNILSETSHPGDPGHNAFTYTAREYHADSGMYYYRARFYDPVVGRFITQDPIGHLGGLNLYAYVGNIPVNFTDPLGLQGPMGFSIETSMIIAEGMEGGYTEIEKAFEETYDIYYDVRAQNPHSLPGPHNGLLDAWRHATFSKRAVEEVGLTMAILAGYGHEIGSYFNWPPQPLEELLMDLHNNREGRKIADTQKEAIDLLKEGLLRIIKPEYRGKGIVY